MIETFQQNPQKDFISVLPSFEIETNNDLVRKNINSPIQHYNTFVDLDMKITQNMHDSNQSVRQDMHHSLHNPVHHTHQQSQSAKKIPKSTAEVFMEAKKILKKSPQIRTPSDNQILFQLTEYNQFLSKLVENVSLQCFKGLMKQAKIEEVRERQMLCQQGKPITHIVILLDGKIGICKQQDDFMQQVQTQGQRNPLLKSTTISQNAFSPTKNQSKQKQTKTIQTIIPMDNIFDQISALSCKQIQTIRKRNAVLKRKSSIPMTAGLFLPLPFTKDQFDQYQIDNFINPGEQYGAKVRCRSKVHPHTCITVEKSVLLIIETNLLVYWFEHSFRAKLGRTIEKLKHIPAFSFLQDGKLSECVLHMKKEKKKRNDYIYKQGAQPEKLYILLHGEVKLSKEAKLFEQNPNELYIDRRKLMQKSTEINQKQDQSKKIGILPYANLTSLFNFRPMKKNIDIGVIASNNDYFSLLGAQQLIEKRPRETDAKVISFDCEYYEIEIRKLQDILGSKFIQDFYGHLQKSLKKIILYRQNQYAGKVNLQNRQNLDYFYYQNDKSKESPRKYKLEKINNKFNDTQSNQLFVQTVPDDSRIKKIHEEDDTMKPFYTTFNFQKLIKTERLSHTRKLSERQSKANSSRKRKDSQDSQQISKVKFSPMQERLIDISHTWKPIKKKVIQQIKVMQKISTKRHSININEPLIDQKYFRDVQKQQKRIDREHKIFKLSLGKRTKW